MNFPTQALLQVLQMFSTHKLPEVPAQEINKPYGGWLEIIMTLVGNEQAKPDWCDVLDGGQIKYEVRLAMAIRDELLRRANTAPPLEDVYRWEQLSAGHADYCTKLARKCFEFEMAVVEVAQ